MGKSSQNSPTLVIFWGSTPCVFCVYTCYTKVVSHHDLSVLSTSVMGFKKSLDRGVGSALSIFFGIFLLCKVPYKAGQLSHRPGEIALMYC